MVKQIGTWTCGRCGTVNAEEHERCARCRHRPAFNPWDIAQMSIFTKALLAVGTVLFLALVIGVLSSALNGLVGGR